MSEEQRRSTPRLIGAKTMLLAALVGAVLAGLVGALHESRDQRIRGAAQEYAFLRTSDHAGAFGDEWEGCVRPGTTPSERAPGLPTCAPGSQGSVTTAFVDARGNILRFGPPSHGQQLTATGLAAGLSALAGAAAGVIGVRVAARVRRRRARTQEPAISWSRSSA